MATRRLRSASDSALGVAPATVKDEWAKLERRNLLDLIALLVTAYNTNVPSTRGVDEEAAFTKAKVRVKTKVPPLDHYTFAQVLCEAVLCEVEDGPPKLADQIRAVQKAQKMLDINRARELGLLRPRGAR